jgi:hypothetical protein
VWALLNEDGKINRKSVLEYFISPDLLWDWWETAELVFGPFWLDDYILELVSPVIIFLNASLGTLYFPFSSPFTRRRHLPLSFTGSAKDNHAKVG